MFEAIEEVLQDVLDEEDPTNEFRAAAAAYRERRAQPKEY